MSGSGPCLGSISTATAAMQSPGSLQGSVPAECCGRLRELLHCPSLVCTWSPSIRTLCRRAYSNMSRSSEWKVGPVEDVWRRKSAEQKQHCGASQSIRKFIHIWLREQAFASPSSCVHSIEPNVPWPQLVLHSKAYRARPKASGIELMSV